MLQLVGASKSAASIPFQVFHMPNGHAETLKSWLERTLSSNPVETMFGLYDIVCTIHVRLYNTDGGVGTAKVCHGTRECQSLIR